MQREGKLLLTAEDRTAKAFAAVDGRMKGISSTVARMGSLIPAASIAALTAAAKAAIQHADAVGDQAQRVGLTTTAYQELSFAAKQLDVDQSQLEGALIRFRDRLGEARMGSKEAAADFKRLGIDPQQFRDTDQAFAAVTRRLGELGDEFARNTLQTNLFGKSAGPQLTGFLTTSTAEVSRLRQEAHELGSVLSQETIDKADAAAKKLDALANVTKTQLTTALVDLAPAVVAAGNAAALSAKGWGLLTVAVQDAYAATEKYFANQTWMQIAENNRKAAQPLIDTYNELAEAIKRVEGSDSPSAGARADILRRRQKEVEGQLATYGVGYGATTTRGVAPEFADEAAAPANTRALLNPDSAKAGDKAAKDALRLEEEINEIYARNIELITGKDAAALQHEATLTDLNELFARGLIPTQEEYNAAVERAEAVYAKTGASASVFADQAARNIQSLTTNLISAAMAGENMGDAIVSSLQRIAAEMAAQAALEAIFGAFGSGGGFGIGLAGVSAAGLGLIGGRASGGPVAANEPYVVGEEGPELFVPHSAGYIVPNNQLGAGGKTVNVNASPVINIDARGATPEMLPLLHRMMLESEQRVKAHMYEAIRRGYV
jgi:hypothetical protein